MAKIDALFMTKTTENPTFGNRTDRGITHINEFPQGKRKKR